MKVNIGPYLNYVGPYQVVGLLKHLGVSEDRCDSIAEWLTNNFKFLDTLANWIYENRKRKIKVKIDNYDVWSADHTLALIILPVLKKLREDLQCSPFIDNEDVPEHLRYNNWATNEQFQFDMFADDEYDTAVWNALHKKWEWVIDEIIWAFECKLDSTSEDKFWKKYDFPLDDESIPWYKRQGELDVEGLRKHNERVSNGFRLFGKYYEALWT